MKTMIKKISILCLSAVLFSGCTDNFEEMNKNPFTTTDVTPGYMFKNMLGSGVVNYGIWTYQVGDNLHVHLYAQYFAVINSGFTTDRYGWMSAWVNDGFWYAYYSNTLRRKREVENWIDEHPEWNNMYQIMRIADAIGAGRTTDLFGDVPYFDAGSGNLSPVFDSQKDIYYALFEELKEAIAALRSNTYQEAFLDIQDTFYGGNVEQWIRLANSIRLRFALRLSYIDPDKAKAEGEAALADIMLAGNADNAGHMTNLEDNYQGHPLYYIGNWNDFRASKTMMDILKHESSVTDPRLPLWFGQTQGYTYGTFEEQYSGVPNGLLASQMTQEEYLPTNTSAVWGLYFNEEWNLHAKGSLPEGSKPEQIGVLRPLMAMNYAEVCFLKAEAALRGWAGAGNARTHYEEGIRASFEEFRDGVTPSLYTTDYDDAYIGGGNVKWDDGNDFETKLKQIITQKWLAIYPNGSEAWSEFRRTGYPLLNPVIATDINVIGQGEFIKKLPYTEQETNSNPNGLDGSLNQGQGDGQNVRVWWDTGRYK